MPRDAKIWVVVGHCSDARSLKITKAWILLTAFLVGGLEEMLPRICANKVQVDCFLLFISISCIELEHELSDSINQ